MCVYESVYDRAECQKQLHPAAESTGRCETARATVGRDRGAAIVRASFDVRPKGRLSRLPRLHSFSDFGLSDIAIYRLE